MSLAIEPFKKPTSPHSAAPTALPADPEQSEEMTTDLLPPERQEALRKLEQLVRRIFLQRNPSSPPLGHFRATTCVYEGQMRDGQMHGKGACVWDAGGSYIGGFQNNQRHGFGTLCNREGDFFEGTWENDHLQNFGVCYDSTGNIIYEGEWQRGMRHGYGKEKHSNNRYYVGSFECDKRHGLGTFFFSEGKRHEGQFQNGRPHGLGTRIYENGNRRTCEWQDNRARGPGTITFASGNSYPCTFVREPEEELGELLPSDGDPHGDLFYLHDFFPQEHRAEPPIIGMPAAAPKETRIDQYTAPDKKIFLEPLKPEDRRAWYFFFNSFRMLNLPAPLATGPETQPLFSEEARQYQQTRKDWDLFLPVLDEWQNLRFDPADIPKTPSVGTHLMQSQEKKHVYGTGLSPSEIQQKYDFWYATTIQKVSLFLASHGDSPAILADLLSILGYERRLMAFSANTNRKSEFGRLRFTGLQTGISKASAVHHRVYAEQFLNKFSGKNPEESSRFKTLRYRGLIGNVILPLTILDLESQQKVRIHHAPPLTRFPLEDRKITQAHLQTLFTEILQTQEKKVLLQKIASLHWWLAQLTLFERGSASISEVLILGLFRYKGHLVQWKPTVSPDLEAMLRTEQEFVADYEKFIRPLE